MNKAIIGLQWGDEGKGKIVDYLSEHFDLVVRYQGGNNAGHTVIVNDTTYKLNLIPSGVIRGKTCYLGQGVVLDPNHFSKEYDQIKKKLVNPKVFLSSNISFHADSAAPACSLTLAVSPEIVILTILSPCKISFTTS